MHWYLYKIVSYHTSRKTETCLPCLVDTERPAYTLGTAAAFRTLFFKMQEFEVYADPSHLLLAACLVVATYFEYRSLKPPNPPPSRDKQVKDVMVSGRRNPRVHDNS